MSEGRGSFLRKLLGGLANLIFELFSFLCDNCLLQLGPDSVLSLEHKVRGLLAAKNIIKISLVSI